MCYSAEVSFGASAYLLATGVACVKQSRSRKELAVSSLPLTFSFQQLLEGLLWLDLEGGSPHSLYRQMIIYSWLFFALFYWPVAIPTAFAYLEKKKWRKKLLIVLSLAGLALSTYLLVVAFSGPVSAKLVCCTSVSYGYNIDLIKLKFLTYSYGYILTAALFLSSFPGSFIIAIANAVCFHAALIYYAETFTSVWCFFMAIVSSFYCYLLFYRNRYLEPLSIKEEK